MNPETAALDVVDEVGERMRERGEQARRDEESRERWTSARLRRARVAVLAAVGAALVLAILGVGISIYAAGRSGGATAAEVAPEVAAQVAAQTIADSRGSRLDAAKASLTAANTILVSRGLGTVPTPDPTRYTAATLPDAYVIAASTAQTLAYLPDPIVAGLQVDPTTGRLVVPASILVNPPASSSPDPPTTTGGFPTLVPGPEVGTPGDRVLPRTLAPGGRATSPAAPPRGRGGSSSPAPGVPLPVPAPLPSRLPTRLPPLLPLPTDLLPPPLPVLPSLPPLIGGLVT